MVRSIEYHSTLNTIQTAYSSTTDQVLLYSGVKTLWKTLWKTLRTTQSTSSAVRVYHVIMPAIDSAISQYRDYDIDSSFNKTLRAICEQLLSMLYMKSPDAIAVKITINYLIITPVTPAQV